MTASPSIDMPESAAEARERRWAAIAILLYTAVLLAVSLLLHPTPLYYVETDLVGEYIPAARSLSAGQLDPGHYAYKGPGYPLLLAAVAPLAGGDHFLAARLLSVMATGVAAAFAFLVVRSFAGHAVALLMLAGLLLNPTFIRYAVEAGTDAPALALSLVATYSVLRAPSRAWLMGAGLAAGCATITRYNAAFLLPAAALVLALRPRRLANLGWYVVGVILPLGGWIAINAQMTGHAFRNDNYLSIAYELYGGKQELDQFGARVGTHFHSLGQVLAFDPARAAARIVWNLAAHFISDLRDLLPLWIGLIAGPGLILGFRRPEWRGAAIHCALCALILAPVFYSSRFSIYLLPFYLAGAAALLLALPNLLARQKPELQPRLRIGALVAGGILVLASGALGIAQVRTNLADAPHETRAFGRILAAHGLRGERVLARKPHVAHYAGMEFTAMGVPSSLLDLIARARAAKAGYVLYSPIERVHRPDFAILSDSALALPGLEQVAYRSWGPRKSYALYRVTAAAVDSTAMAKAVEAALWRYLARRPDDPEAQLFAATQLMGMGRNREALDRLLAIEKLSGGGPVVANLMSTAYLGLGDYEQSFRACERAMRLGRPTAWHYARLGLARQRQRRMEEARGWYRRAVEMEPGNPEYQESLGLVCVALGEFAPAAAAFERCVALAPGSAAARRNAMGAYQLAGNDRRAREILDGGTRLGIPMREMLDPAAAAAR